MSKQGRQATTCFDLIIVVDDVDAIKVWAEEIECALAGVQPANYVARSGIIHLDRYKSSLQRCKKLLFMLDINKRTFQTSLMEDWIRHFDNLNPKDIMCVLVNNDHNNVLDHANLEKGRFQLIVTDEIGQFQNWWPSLIAFLFLNMKEPQRSLVCVMENINTHPDEMLTHKLKQCLDKFIMTRNVGVSAKSQTVKVIGRPEESTTYGQEHLHIVIVSQFIQRSEFKPCTSVHYRAEVLRCVLFVLIDAGIIPVRRFTRVEQAMHTTTRCVGVLKKLPHISLAVLVFLMNLPAAIMSLAIQFIPVLGVMFMLCYGKEHETSTCKSIGILIIFYVIGSLTATGIVPNVSLHVTITCLFMMPTVYIIGWMIVANYVFTSKYSCEYGIWSLPSRFWCTSLRLPRKFKIAYIPIIVLHFLVLSLLCFPIGVTVIVYYIIRANRRVTLTKLTCSGIFYNVHVLGSEAVLIIIGLTFFNIPILYFVIICIAIFLYFLSFSLLDNNSINDSCTQYMNIFLECGDDYNERSHQPDTFLTYANRRDRTRLRI